MEKNVQNNFTNIHQKSAYKYATHTYKSIWDYKCPHMPGDQTDRLASHDTQGPYGLSCHHVNLCHDITGLHSAPSFVTWARWLQEKRVYSLGSVALTPVPCSQSSQAEPHRWGLNSRLEEGNRTGRLEAAFHQQLLAGGCQGDDSVGSFLPNVFKAGLWKRGQTT